MSATLVGAKPSLKQIVRLGWERLMQNRALAVLGLIGIVLGLFCFAVMFARGGVPIPPEGDLEKPATFNIAVGIYILTIALLLPSAGFSDGGRRRWVAWTVVFFVYGYTVETVQTFRGLDPRFSKVGTPWDQMIGGIFFLTAVSLLVLFIIMAIRFFRRRVDTADATVLLAIKYGCVTTLGAFAAGVWMSVIGGRHTGAAGNILPLHALGFHGLQTVPVVALLLLWAGEKSEQARKWVHLTGIAWLAACVAVASQTIRGKSVFEIGPATLVTAFVLAVWSALALFAFWRWARVPIPPESPGTSRTPTANTSASPPRR